MAQWAVTLKTVVLDQINTQVLQAFDSKAEAETYRDQYNRLLSHSREFNDITPVISETFVEELTMNNINYLIVVYTTVRTYDGNILRQSKIVDTSKMENETSPALKQAVAHPGTVVEETRSYRSAAGDISQVYHYSTSSDALEDALAGHGTLVEVIPETVMAEAQQEVHRATEKRAPQRRRREQREREAANRNRREQAARRRSSDEEKYEDPNFTPGGSPIFWNTGRSLY